MSNGDGPPPMFDGDDFPYWKIRMESYLEACDTKCLKAATEGFAPPERATALTPQEQENEKWNAKAKNHIFRGLCKRCSTAFGATKPPMNFGRNFVRSMRDQRVNARNAIT